MLRFYLSNKFVSGYADVPPPFGFGALSEAVFYRTYSREKQDGTNERWHETVRRVVEGTYNMQKKHIDRYNLGWDNAMAQKSAQEMYDRIFNLKFLPPGRGLWAMGSPITEEKGLYAALNNCAFTTTENIKDDPALPFRFLMDLSMLGVGVGFDTKGSGKLHIRGADRRRKVSKIEIPDTREGWVDSVGQLIESHVFGLSGVEFDYSLLREAGVPIKTFGGVSSGPEPLQECHERLNELLYGVKGRAMSSTTIVDIMNIIGKCVVSGNVRRTAENALGDKDDEEFLDLKNKEAFPERNHPRNGWGWTSNNSVFGELGMSYREVAERAKENGEPGCFWLSNAQDYGRMLLGPDGRDHRVVGCNPCFEQSLEDKELCTLVETFPHRHDDLRDYQRTLKFAYLYAKTVTLGQTHWPQSNRVMLRNRRIGCSMSGVAQFIENRGLHELKTWCEAGYLTIRQYDDTYSDWLAVPKSIKVTSIKPSGSVSLLAGATPGMHYPVSRYYIRRMRVPHDSALVEPLREAGYTIEESIIDKKTLCVEFPIDSGCDRGVGDLSIWEQFSLAAFLQRYWADNQVSFTGTFKQEEGWQLEQCFNYFQYQLKGASVLPERTEAYAQLPYESISRARYYDLTAEIKCGIIQGIKGEVADTEKFCDGDTCSLGGDK